jgi:hypothetical protein
MVGSQDVHTPSMIIYLIHAAVTRFLLRKKYISKTLETHFPLGVVNQYGSRKNLWTSEQKMIEHGRTFQFLEKQMELEDSTMYYNFVKNPTGRLIKNRLF